MQNKLIDLVDKRQVRKDLPDFKSGDNVKVYVRIREGNKERIQVFEGLVIRRKGSLSSETFTVRKISYGIGVERIFFVNSPSISNIEIVRENKVRRAKLYYMRNLQGKSARLKEKVKPILQTQNDTKDQKASPKIKIAKEKPSKTTTKSKTTKQKTT